MADKEHSGLPYGYTVGDVFRMGNDGLLFRQRNSAFVVKVALFDQKSTANELQVYQRLAR